jgi:hypothetical protein
MKSKFFLTALFVLFILFTKSQTDSKNSNPTASDFPYWIEMMQNPNANYYATVDSFNKYFEHRDKGKGTGWKAFKRWEYIHANDVLPDGKLISQEYILSEFKRTNSGKSISGNWTELGPILMPTNGTGQPNGLGRVNAIGFHPTNASIMYAGAPSGGFWRTTNAGTTWESNTDNAPTLGVSAILVNNSTPNIIYIGTGDRDAGDASGLGVFKSTDSGISWVVSNTGMGNVTVGRMVIHPTNPGLILAASSNGIYKTTNAGANWLKTSSNSSNYKDIAFNPANPNIVYAVQSGNFYRSTNTGDNWGQVTLPVTGTRAVIGVSPNQSNWVYVVQTNGPFVGLLKSTDSGQNFTTQSTTPNLIDYSCDGSGSSSQAWYDLCVAVTPTNANIIFVGGINIFRSTDGGINWAINGHWTGDCGVSAIHADVHTLAYSPVNGYLYTGTDGGVHVNTTGGTGWTDKSVGLAIAQTYKLGQSKLEKNLVINGFQDNGTAILDGTSWRTEIGGDGMECEVDYTNSNYIYGEYVAGTIYRSDDRGYNFYEIGGNINETGDWVTPFCLNKTNPNTMYIGMVNIWRNTSVRNSTTWTNISNGTVGGGNFIVVEASSANPNLLYASKNSTLYRCDNVNDASPTWTRILNPLGGYNITDIKAHPTNENIVFGTCSGRVYKSVNKGASWTLLTRDGLPNIPINTLVIDKSNADDCIYVGTNAGVYYLNKFSFCWLPFSSGLPTNVSVRELEIYYDAVPSQSRIRAVTYGRGMWESDLYDGPNAIYGSNKGNNSVNIFPNPATNSLNLQFAQIKSNTTISICTIEGKEVYSEKIKDNGENILKTIDVTGFSKGIYFLTISDNESKMLKKIVIQ